jgi:hypothetical protein
MPRSLKLCQWLGVSPRLYLGSLIIGFLGSISCLITQAMEVGQGWALLSLLFALAPFIVINLPAYRMKKLTAHLVVKSLTGNLLTFFIAIVPGATLGMFLGSCSLASPQ